MLSSPMCIFTPPPPSPPRSHHLTETSFTIQKTRLMVNLRSLRMRLGSIWCVSGQMTLIKLGL
ncbi:hypothetical protein M8C21_012971 [Ambrosia artemisiifolia]|uniref:Uncharacterized protein n=1 Tax=Ambrosia artemisiifolia TaxID=4212 RepID=A0AAD5CBI9_AMBAR|nr:hypothetical protein M8C21_012971 [Ambrosia artemisiifolia]